MYLKEEIQAEALVRNVGSFSRFLNIAAQFNGQAVVYNNLAASSGVPRSSVANYFDILEETLIATRLWEHGSSEKDKSKPKLYFFDCGVVRAIQQLIDQLFPLVGILVLQERDRLIDRRQTPGEINRDSP